MKKVLIIVGLLLTALIAIAAWLLRTPSVSIRDVRQTETLVLRRGLFDGNIHALHVRGSGEIDGEATMTLILNGQPYRVANLKGNVDFAWGGDWYSDTAEIRYEPSNVRSGRVVLKYRFNSFQD